MSPMSVLVISIILRLAVLLVACFAGVITTILLFLRFLRNPVGFFHKKNRSEPACLHDPKYGVHHKLKLPDGRMLHYVANGNPANRLMLLIHGFPESWWCWRNQLTEFSRDHYVIAMSLPGFSESDSAKQVCQYQVKHLVNDVRVLLEQLGSKQAVVIGHDWGGGIAWHFAYCYPQMVDRLVVLDCPPIPVFAGALFKNGQFLRSLYIFLHQLPFLPELFYRNTDMQFFDRVMTSRKYGVVDQQLISKEDLECVKYYYGKRGFTEPVNYYRQVLSVSSLAEVVGDKLKGRSFRIKPKTLILWGANDNFLNTSLAYDSAAVCEDAKVIVVNGASHWLQQHEPVFVNKAIRDFLNDH